MYVFLQLMHLLLCIVEWPYHPSFDFLFRRFIHLFVFILVFCSVIQSKFPSPSVDFPSTIIMSGSSWAVILCPWCYYVTSHFKMFLYYLSGIIMSSFTFAFLLTFVETLVFVLWWLCSLKYNSVASKMTVTSGGIQKGVLGVDIEQWPVFESRTNSQTTPKLVVGLCCHEQ